MKKEIRDGLLLRSLSEGVASDAQNLGQFYVDVFTDEGADDGEIFLPWMDDFLGGNHPTVSLDDIWVVVDPSQNDRIVSALLLIPQTWRYDHIEMKVGRVEIVATHTDYRRRGLIRELMTVAHERSASLGHIMQGITGIGHYYRRFGYAMAINLGSDAQLPIAMIPKLKPDQMTKYTLRLAVTSDIPNLVAWEAYEQRDGGLTLKRDASDWEFDINYRHPNSPPTPSIYIIVDSDGHDVGFVTFKLDKYYQAIYLWQYIVGDQSSYYDTFDDVLRAIKMIADDFYATLPEDKYPRMIYFENGISSVVKTMIHKTDGRINHDRVYAWYVRVDDLPALIKHLAPVLEKRLEGSGMNRFTGELNIGLFDLNRIQIVFEAGKIKDVLIVEITKVSSDTAFPYHTFLNILFGHRDWRELTHILPEVYANRKADMLLTALFPKMRTFLGSGVG